MYRMRNTICEVRNMQHYIFSVLKLNSMITYDHKCLLHHIQTQNLGVKRRY